MSWKNILSIVNQIGNAIQYDQGMPLLGICVWKILTCAHWKACAIISTAILFVGTGSWQAQIEDVQCKMPQKLKAEQHMCTCQCGGP